MNTGNPLPDENGELYAKQLQEKMKVVVGNLSPQCREAFTLSRYDHLSYKDIAGKNGFIGEYR